VCGVDEAGRGPLAGPVCAAAVILPPHLELPGLDDSKKLTDKRRRELFPLIKEQAIAYGIGLASHEEIDEINILQATFLAMERALVALNVKPDHVLIDGNRAKDFGLPVTTVVKGDSLSANVAAASILAKVTRDMIMEEEAVRYPQYGFEIHKGYGTKAHYEALGTYGPSPIHRMTFLKKFYGEK
jgi:ribonuclease HII